MLGKVCFYISLYDAFSAIRLRCFINGIVVNVHMNPVHVFHSNVFFLNMWSSLQVLVFGCLFREVQYTMSTAK